MASLSKDEIDWVALAKAFNKLPFSQRKAQSGELVLKFSDKDIQAHFCVAGLDVPEHKKNHTVMLSSKNEARLWKKAYSTYRSLKKACT